MRGKYIIKVLHHPDELIHSTSISIPVTQREKLHLTFHRTFIQAILEYFGDPDYDVTPYNQRTFILTVLDGSLPPLRSAVELIKKADRLNSGDSITNVLFDESGKVIAKLTVNVRMFTFDSLDPRNQKHWDAIASRVQSIVLECQDKEVSADLIWKASKLKNDQEFWKFLREFNVPRELVEMFIKYLEILSDDFVTAMLRRLSSDNSSPFDVAFDLFCVL